MRFAGVAVSSHPPKNWLVQMRWAIVLSLAWRFLVLHSIFHFQMPKKREKHGITLAAVVNYCLDNSSNWEISWCAVGMLVVLFFAQMDVLSK